MWFLMALVSALLLGFYDVAKKYSLKGNAVIPVLFLTTLFSALLFLPLIVGSRMGWLAPGSLLYVPSCEWALHRWVVLKALIVLGSWMCGYFAIKHLPLTIVGPVNAARPVIVVVGALLFFGERLNAWQWLGVGVAAIAFVLLGNTGRKEGISFVRNRWVFLLVLAAILGAASGLYDKYLMSRIGLHPFFVQSWFSLWQAVMMLVVLLVWWRSLKTAERPQHGGFTWRGSILLIPLFLSAADACYFHALADSDALIAIVSMVRRSSVIVSFVFGAIFFHEKQIRSKAADLLLLLLSMVFLCLGAMSEG